MNKVMSALGDVCHFADHLVPTSVRRCLLFWPCREAPEIGESSRLD